MRKIYHFLLFLSNRFPKKGGFWKNRSLKMGAVKFLDTLKTCDSTAYEYIEEDFQKVRETPDR
jgi:hypothetical protein